MNKISPKWSKFAEKFINCPNGQHCHWCKFMKSEEGCVTCEHPKSKYNDGDRIRSWDGKACAEDCGYFEIDEHYTKDENFERY